MRSRPLLAVAISSCTVAAFFIEVSVEKDTLFWSAILCSVGLLTALITQNRRLLRPLAAFGMGTFIAIQIATPWVGAGAPSKSVSGRFEGQTISAAKSGTGWHTVIAEGEVDLKGAPASRCTVALRWKANETRNPKHVQNGTTILSFGSFAPLRLQTHTVLFDEYRWARGLSVSMIGQVQESDLHLLGEEPTHERVLHSLRLRIKDYLEDKLDGTHAALANGLVFGDRAAIDKEVSGTFQRIGVAHILSVSGTHVGLIVIILASILGALSRSVLLVLVTIILLVSYTILTGADPPAVRACMMTGVAIFGRLLQREVDLPNILGFVTITMLLWTPELILRSSFYLSSIITYGILVLHPMWIKMIDSCVSVSQTWIRKTFSGVALNMSACTVASVPTMLAFGSVALMAPIANMVIVPIMLGTMIAIVALVGLGSWVPLLEPALIWCIEVGFSTTLGAAAWFVDFSSVLDPVTIVIVSLLNATVLLWLLLSTRANGLITRAVVSCVWIYTSMTIVPPTVMVELVEVPQGLLVCAESSDRSRFAVISHRFGAVFVRSLHDQHSTSIQR